MEPWLSGAIIGGIGGGLTVLVIALLMPARKCPQCGESLPRFRKPARTRPLQDILGDEQVPPPAFWQGLELPPEFLAVIRQQEKLLRDLDLGVTPRQFLTDVVGDAVVFAFRKGGPKPDPDQRMLLTWA